MDISKIHSIIIKFLNKEANNAELDELETSLKNTKYVPLFNQLVRIDYLIALCMKKYDLDEAKQTVKVKLRTKRKEKRRYYFKYASVAAAVLFIVFLSLYKFDREESIITNTDTIVNQKVESGSDKAVLTLEDGEQIALEKGKQYQGQKVRSNGEELVYAREKDSYKVQKPGYNYLSVPRGGQFLLKLSDGTKVWLNSESKLKYPKSFVLGTTREVELEYGEAYFEVTPSEQYNGASFNVRTREQTVNVLGTKFNIRATKDDDAVITTLAEGSVKIESSSDSQLLKPNQQATVNNASYKIVVEEVDATIMTAWVRGLFIFEDKYLYEMMDDLSRWYDVEVFFASEKSRNTPFTGVLERTKTLNELLVIIEASSGDEVKFEIKDNVLLIK